MFVFHVSVSFNRTRVRRKVFVRVQDIIREEFNIVAKNEAIARTFLESSYGKDAKITFEDSALVHVILPEDDSDDRVLLLTHALSSSRNGKPVDEAQSDVNNPPIS